MDNIVRALKVFVIAGGIVLLAGTVLLVVLITMRGAENRSVGADDPRAAGAALADPSAAQARLCQALAAPEPPGGALEVPLPAGARVEQVVPGGGCLILLGVDGGGRQFVALVDPFSGARISLLLIRPEE